MTTPDDPFASPGQPEHQPGYGQPPAQPGGYGAAPALGQPPTYGQPAPGQPAYGQAPAYGQPAYGQPSGSAWQGPPLASWGQRVGAFLVDALLGVAIIVIGVLVALGLGQVSSTLGTLVIVVAYLGAFAFGVWQLVVQGQTGATIGKRKLKIRLLREQDGQVVGGGMSVLRSIVHVVDGIPCYLGYLWPLWDAKKQTFADKIMNTVVVKE